MNSTDLVALLPLIITAATAVVVMMVIAFYRNHRAANLLTLAGLLAALVSLPLIAPVTPRMVTSLLIMDRFALYYMGLVFFAGFTVACLSYSYLNVLAGHHEEYYLLLLFATVGTAVLAASAHFASFFLGLEILSVSLYAMTAYLRHRERSIEAGIKYLILAAVSSAFILFGMALVYAETGSMAFSRIAYTASSSSVRSLLLTAGVGMIITGLGFKLAVVPFHLWTPDVYEGAPAPVSAFIATVSKGGVFALVLRYFSQLGIDDQGPLFLVLAIIAAASMFAGNLLALLQRNVKRILAYSSISHLGYLFVTLLSSGALAISAAAFYLAAYFVTMLGAFGVVTLLSQQDRDADDMAEYAGLAWRRPWLAAIFTAMLLSLAGIPLTAGFIGKFYVVAAGVGSALWLLVIILVINSAIGLFYYLRIIVVVYSQPEGQPAPLPALSRGGYAVLAGLMIILIWLGVYPSPVIQVIQTMALTVK